METVAKIQNLLSLMKTQTESENNLLILNNKPFFTSTIYIYHSEYPAR